MIYDPFQQKAIEYINNGQSVIVSAPTGAGKTVIAEHVIAKCIHEGQKVIYTAPIKALSNQKYRDFTETTRHQVGILTGDVTLNPKAPVLIMTTEIFRNKILEEEGSLNEYAWIIFDEIHYIDDYERGSVWEESLIFLPSHMNLLGLSATVPNVDQLAGWIQSIHHKPIKVVKEDKRPVPLHFLFQCQNRFYDDYQKLVKYGYDVPALSVRHGHRIPSPIKSKSNSHHSLIDLLLGKNLLPCIYFVFSRRRTEILAEELAGYNFLDEEERERIRVLYDQLCERFELKGDSSAEELKPFVQRGIAYHHAGMLPTLKEVVEQLFTTRLVKIIFTTETFALGINMPAKTVVFDELRKYYGIQGRLFDVLRTRDFYQMAGRAGRRSIDKEGYIFCRVNPHNVSPQRLHKMIYSAPEDVRSQFNASYATLLNLYQHYGENLYDVYPRSFHYYQVARFHRKQAVHTMKAKVDILKELGHIKDGALTAKGQFAGKVYGFELILAELYSDGVLEKLSEAELGVLAMAAVYEARKGTHKPRLSPRAEALDARTRKILKHIHMLERFVGLKDKTRRFQYHLSPVMEAWIKGKAFDEVLKLINVDEGEVVRNFRMSIQILREIAQAPVSDGLYNRIYKLIDRINRDVVDSEKQLRS